MKGGNQKLRCYQQKLHVHLNVTYTLSLQSNCDLWRWLIWNFKGLLPKYCLHSVTQHQPYLCSKQSSKLNLEKSWHGIATSYYEHVKMKLIKCNEMSRGFRIRATLSLSIPVHVSFVMFFLAAKLKIQVCISLTDRSDKTSSCACNSPRSPLDTSWSYCFGVTCHNQLSCGRTARRANYSIYVERLAIRLQKHGFAFSVMCRAGTLPPYCWVAPGSNLWK